MRSRCSTVMCAAVVVLGAAACGSSARAGSVAFPATTTVPSSSTTVPATTTSTTLHAIQGTVNALGDSVLLDASPTLRALVPTVVVDAAVDRSALPGLDILASLAAAGRLGPEIVFALGTNGGVSARVLQRVLDIAAGRRVVMVTSHCPHCGSIPAQNDVMRAQCQQTNNCFVADWDALAAKHPAWFAADGVHMAVGGPGAAAFAHLIRSKL
jgi:hypothetical protein